MTLYIDVHEPSQALSLISPVVSAEVLSLNTDGWADYRWKDCSGEQVHVERKQWGEVLGGIDKVEEVLRKYMELQPKARLVFLLEGMATPVMDGIATLKQTNNGRLYHIGHQYRMRPSQVYAWLTNVQKYVEVVQTSCYDMSVIALTAMYKNDQKEAHSTFQRHFKQITFSPNPQVVQLMGLIPNIGESRAKALIHQFVTVYQVLTASPEELASVPGIGKVLALQILRRVGRVDV